jgi:Uma2 family endonuclease
MGSTARKIENYTIHEYQKLPEAERLEIIDGTTYDMSPSPTVKHQIIAGHFFGIARDCFRGKECKPFIAPMDVVLDDINVVQPDVFIVCDRSKITEANIKGAPDLIIEVLSPATSLKDRREKKRIYQDHGVREYIIVSPTDETTERFTLVDGSYGGADIFGWHDSFASRIFPELIFNMRVIFEKENVEYVADPNVPEWLKEELKRSGVL